MRVELPIRKLGEYNLCLSSSLAGVSLALALLLAPSPGRSQPGLWEQLTSAGNQALSGDMQGEAENNYWQALQVADRFAPEDLGKAKARRNLPQALFSRGATSPPIPFTVKPSPSLA